MNEKQVAAWKALCSSYARLVGNLEQNGTLSEAEVEEVMYPVSEFWDQYDSEETAEPALQSRAPRSPVVAGDD